jgi:hypothetical protein
MARPQTSFVKFVFMIVSRVADFFRSSSLPVSRRWKRRETIESSCGNYVAAKRRGLARENRHGVNTPWRRRVFYAQYQAMPKFFID